MQLSENIKEHSYPIHELKMIPLGETTVQEHRSISCLVRHRVCLSPTSWFDILYMQMQVLVAREIQLLLPTRTLLRGTSCVVYVCIAVSVLE